MLDPGPHTAGRWDEMEASLKAALHDAICDGAGALASYYRAEIAEMKRLREPVPNGTLDSTVGPPHQR